MQLKKFLFTILVLGFITSCEKEDNQFQSSAIITGPDLGQCPCCGGYYIEVSDSTYNFNNLPMGTDIDLSTETFPIEVNINWEYDVKCGNIQYIEITEIERK